MESLWVLIIVYLLLFFGLFLCFVGKFPGQILAYAGLLVAAFKLDNHEYPVWLLVVCGILVIASIIINKKVAPKVAAKVHEFGKAGRIGTTIGSILSILLIAVGINEIVAIILFLVFPYLFAFLFEFIAKKDAAEGAKRGAGAYTLFALSTLINLAICVVCLGQVLFGWFDFAAREQLGGFASELREEISSEVQGQFSEIRDQYSEVTGAYDELAQSAAALKKAAKEEVKCTKLVAKYEKLVNKYISAQMKSGKFNPKLFSKVLELSEEINRSIGNCSPGLNLEFLSLERKFANAAMTSSALGIDPSYLVSMYGPAVSAYLDLLNDAGSVFEDRLAETGGAAFTSLDDLDDPDDLVGLFDTASRRLLTEVDLYGRNEIELRILRNAIYARHGYIFKSDDLRNYFSRFPWYVPSSSDVSSQLSSIEKKNIEFIKAHE